MTQYFQLAGGQVTEIPGVYASLEVANSPVNPVPAGRSVLILGESSEGLPGNLLKLSSNFFVSFDAVQAYYKDGPVVDAARMLFTKQPSPAFPGSIQRLYVYKTNQTLAASRALVGPSGYGSLVSSKFGERGNTIQSQIVSGQSEVLPSKTMSYLSSPAARSFKVSADGVVTSSLAVVAGGTAAQFVTAMSTASGLSATGGATRTLLTGAGPLLCATTVSGDTLTITRSSGSETFNAGVKVGDSAYIAYGVNTINGPANQNAGAYVVTAVSSLSLSLKQIKHTNATLEIDAVAMYAGGALSLAAADMVVSAPVTLAVSATTATGAAASLELLENTGSRLAAGMMYRDADATSILVNSTSAIANISATVPAAGQLSIALSIGSFTTTPSAGDLISIPRGSVLAAGNANVGLYLVESANSRSISVSRLFSGQTTTAVASVALAGANDALSWAPGFVSSGDAARLIASASEAKVSVIATRASDGLKFPTTAIGGAPTLAVSYYNAAATAATLTIDAQRHLTLSPTGTGLTDLVVNTNKYQTLGALVDFLNSQPGVAAKVMAPAYLTLSTKSLDMATAVGCLGGTATSAYNGIIKKDYYDWNAFFAKNQALITFLAGNMVLLAGLPSVESSITYLSGAEVGATSTGDIQAGLDAALKIDVRQVVPLFSRDAAYDVTDGLTDAGSSYTIASINAAVKAHVATASDPLFGKARYGVISYDGTFADTVNAVGEIAYERCQMTFQRHSAAMGDGSLQIQLPYIGACAIAAGRSQAALGTAMLRKPFQLNSAVHTGTASLYDESQTTDFDPDSRADLAAAIDAGLFVFRAVTGFGVRGESPDLSTRSRLGDPTGYFYERINLELTADEVLDACKNVLENFIGERTTDTPLAVVGQAVKNVLSTYVGGALVSADLINLSSTGNVYTVKIKLVEAETLEAISLDAQVARSST